MKARADKHTLHESHVKVSLSYSLSNQLQACYRKYS